MNKRFFRFADLKQSFLKSIKSLRMPKQITFFVLGLVSTIWFLIRVIPKPSRAAYPCMQTAAPFMSAFVLWLIGLGGGVIAFKNFIDALKSSRYSLAVFFLLISFSLLFTFQFQSSQPALANEIRQKGEFPPNQPMGIAQGVFPGRVVWMYNPDATNINCSNTSNQNGIIDEGDDIWFMEHNNDAVLIDSMISKSLISLTGATNCADSWNAMFEFYNEKAGNGSIGFQQGEIVFIKLNVTTAHGEPGQRYYEDLSRNDDPEVNQFAAETNPYVVLAVLRQLVEEAGVPEEMIYVGDPARNIYKEQFDLWHGSFPNVKYLGNNLLHPELDVEALGRTAVSVTEEKKVFWSDEGEIMDEAIHDELFKIFEDMDYLINIPTLKAHSSAGITLAAKNHFGSFTRFWAMHLHPGLFEGVDDPQRLGYGLYRVQTDIMMHNLLSGKNLLILVDGLYPGEDAMGVPEKWQSIPFNNDWCSSVFVSLDPVAIESVCHDFLRTEYNGPTIPESRPNWPGVDDYLHQAADSAKWPEGMEYDPDGDGILISSLGVHEHWNDSLHKEYTRNLGTGNGIDLVKAHELHTGLDQIYAVKALKVFPNPASDFVKIENQSIERIEFEIFDSNGKLYLTDFVLANEERKIDLSAVPTGMYILKYEMNGLSAVARILKIFY